jgi:hypothetical protein
VQRGLRAIKATKASESLVTIADVCLCEYTSHGHCGVVARDGEHYEVENDSSVALLAKTAVSLAEAGADVVAPSDMMDGRVAAIRSGAGCGRQAEHADPQLCEQVRVGILRAVSRGSGLGATVRRPQDLPDGRSQPARGDARD